MPDITDTTDKLLAAGQAMVDKLSELGTQYGPQVAELALNTYRLDALNTLVSATLWFLIGACLLGLVLRGVFHFIGLERKHMAWNRAKDRSVPEPYEVDGHEFIFLGFLGIIPLIIVGYSLSILTDMWLWIGLWHPELLMARQVLGLN